MMTSARERRVRKSLIGTRLSCACNTPLHHFYDLLYTMLYDSPMISFLHDPFHHLHSLYFHPYSTDVCHRRPTPTPTPTLHSHSQSRSFLISAYLLVHHLMTS